MRRMILLGLAGMMLLALSCGGGGGGTTPGAKDLSGLEGTWDYNVVVDGTISGPGGSVPFKDTFSGYYIIGRNSIIDDYGDAMVWSYDGSTLSIQWAGSGTFWDADCGDVLVSMSLHKTVPVAPGATVANIGGTMNLSFTTEFCGNMSGVLPMTGNMTRR